MRIASRDPLERVVDPLEGVVDPLPHPPHDPIGGGEEQVALAGKMAVERPLADLQPLGQGLRHGVGVAVLGEQLRRRVEDLLATRQQCLLGTQDTTASPPCS